MEVYILGYLFFGVVISSLVFALFIFFTSPAKSSSKEDLKELHNLIKLRRIPQPSNTDSIRAQEQS